MLSLKERRLKLSQWQEPVAAGPQKPGCSLPEVSSLAGVGAGRAHAAHRGHRGGPQGDADEPALLKQCSVVVGIGALGRMETACALLRSCHGSPGKVGLSLSAPVPDRQLEPSTLGCSALAHLSASRGLLTLPLLAEAGQLPCLPHLLIQHTEQDQHCQALWGEMP